MTPHASLSGLEPGLMQMTRKNVSEGPLEVFSETWDKCGGVVLTKL